MTRWNGCAIRNQLAKHDSEMNQTITARQWPSARSTTAAATSKAPRRRGPLCWLNKIAPAVEASGGSSPAGPREQA
jgi:hypothetical protein